jgi:hypothetical protein
MEKDTVASDDRRRGRVKGIIALAKAQIALLDDLVNETSTAMPQVHAARITGPVSLILMSSACGRSSSLWWRRLRSSRLSIITLPCNATFMGCREECYGRPKRSFSIRKQGNICEEIVGEGRIATGGHDAMTL